MEDGTNRPPRNKFSFFSRGVHAFFHEPLASTNCPLKNISPRSAATMTHPWPAIIDELKKILEEHKVCPSHGIDHALAVMNHAQQALLHWPKLGEQEKFAVLLAA